jgi:hypothetical protein
VHPRTHLLFIIKNDYLPNMLYHYTLFSHSHWFVSTIYEKTTYQSLLFMSIHHPTFHIPHSMSSLLAPSIAEPKLFLFPWRLFKVFCKHICFIRFFLKNLFCELVLLVFTLQLQNTIKKSSNVSSSYVRPVLYLK